MMRPEFFWWGGMWIFPVIMIIVVLVVVYLIFVRGPVRPFRQVPGERNGERADPDTALEILKKRYARGEMTREEFEQIKKDIT